MAGILGVGHYGEAHYGEGAREQVAGRLIDMLPLRLYADVCLTKSILLAYGAEFDQLWPAVRQGRDQPFLQLSTWRLAQHEQTLGLPVDERMTIPDRRARLLKRRARPGSHLDYLRSLVQDAYGQAEPPTVLLDPAARTVVFLNNDPPFPPIPTLLATEDHLSVVGRQGTAHATAGIEWPLGLTFEQINAMQKFAVQALSLYDLMGSPLNQGTLDDWDAMSIDQIDQVGV